MRDFSKLRLEKRLPTTISSSGKKTQAFHEQSVSATEDVDMRFKPSYPNTTNQNSHSSSNEFGYNDPSHYPQHSADRSNSPEDYAEPGFGGFFPPQSQQNPNSYRPLIGGHGLDEDASSVGMSVGPTGYSSEYNPNGNKNNRRPELPNNPDDSNDEDGDVQFILVPHSHDFLSGIENGEGLERGYGGLFDGDSTDADSDDNENDHGYGYGDGEGVGGGGGQGPQEGPDNQDDSSDDSVRGHERIGGGRGSRGGFEGAGHTSRYNLYDYGDY